MAKKPTEGMSDSETEAPFQVIVSPEYVNAGGVTSKTARLVDQSNGRTIATCPDYATAMKLSRGSCQNKDDSDGE